jgi:hypothetical protein
MNDPFYPPDVSDAWGSGRRQGLIDAVNICERGDIIFADSAAVHIKERISKLKERCYNE